MDTELPGRLKKILILVVLVLFSFLVWKNIKSQWYEGERNFFLVDIFGRFAVLTSKGLIFKSDLSWKVKDFLVADFNNDRKDELALLVWKKGSFGKDLPFWLEKNDEVFAGHLFLYVFENYSLRSYWHSSSLEKPICQLFVANVDQKLELQIFEGEYKNNGYSCRNQRETYWYWNGWGFSRVD